MITDSTGRSWKTDLNYAAIKRVKNWPVAESYFDRGENEFKERHYPLGVDLLFLPDLVRLQTNPMEECEVIAAWLHPQWDGKLDRQQFDELLTPEFKESALKALRESVNRFFTGSGGAMTLEEIARAEADLVEKWRLKIRSNLQSILSSDGTSTQESSDLVETPTS